jgi:hypothetical protein
VQPRPFNDDVLEVVDLHWVSKTKDATDRLRSLGVIALTVREKRELLQLLLQRQPGLRTPLPDG